MPQEILHFISQINSEPPILQEIDKADESNYRERIKYETMFYRESTLTNARYAEIGKKWKMTGAEVKKYKQSLEQ